MTTLEKLEEAMQHMQEAKRLIYEAKSENYSLEKHYGYSLQIISERFSAYHPMDFSPLLSTSSTIHQTETFRARVLNYYANIKGEKRIFFLSEK